MVPEEKRAEVFALMHTAFNVGAAVGPVLGLIMFGWHPASVFLIAAFTLLLYGLLVWTKLPETVPADRRQAGPARVPMPKFSWKKHKPLMLITFLSLPVGLLYAQVETTFPLHLQTHFDNYRTVLAAILTFNGLMVILLQIWIARRTESMRPYAVVGASYVLFAAVCIGYGYSSVLLWLFVAEFVFTVGEMIFGPHMQKAISVMAPADQRGFYFSVNNSGHLLTRGLGPILGGMLFNASGGEALFATLAALMLIAGIAQVRVLRKYVVRADG
ncbi:MFS transporter [Paenibacillaceae bacterium WGS1546]|uniref:MFS transporter n=1 Tax=Cohnella sp. WGS1546 TaxID=3366810 RepID=UPI00372D6511